VIPEAKLAWMAAVLDFKGATVRKTNPMRATPQLVLTIESSNIGVIREMCRLTGTSAEARPVHHAAQWMQRGCSEHCPDAHIEHSGEMPVTARWSVTGACAAIVLWNVIPYMVTDRGLRDTMDEALANLVLTGQGSGMVKSAIRRLEALGWALPPAIARHVPVPALSSRAGAARE
jgi:hypothetical protein